MWDTARSCSLAASCGASASFRPHLTSPSLPLPRLPVADWDCFAGKAPVSVPEVTSLPHCLLTTSGTAAIALALEELGVGRGDVVLVPTYHCPTMISPIVALGAVPRFFAIDARGLPVTAGLKQPALQHVKAVIAVHYFGFPRDFGPVRAFCDCHGIALIEDCAHAFFGQIDGRPLGTTGDFAIASLVKFFPVSEGGCVASARQALQRTYLSPQGWREGLRQFSNTIERGARRGRFAPLGPLLSALYSAADRLRGRRSDVVAPSSEVIEQIDPDVATPRFNATRAHQEPAAITRLVVRRADRARIIERRRRNYQLLSEALVGVAGLSVPVPDLPEHVVPYVFPLWVERPERSYAALRRAGVPIFRWDILWPDVPRIPGDVGLDWSFHIFQIGCHQDLTEAEMHTIASRVRSTVGAGS